MTWARYWAIWAAVTFAAFIVPEVYALATDAHRTLSETLWRVEQVRAGEHLAQWSAATGGTFLRSVAATGPKDWDTGDTIALATLPISVTPLAA